jgi:hypothetical protein
MRFYPYMLSSGIMLKLLCNKYKITTDVRAATHMQKMYANPEELIN